MLSLPRSMGWQVVHPRHLLSHSGSLNNKSSPENPAHKPKPFRL